jgi:hypothetical protein
MRAFTQSREQLCPNTVLGISQTEHQKPKKGDTIMSPLPAETYDRQADERVADVEVAEDALTVRMKDGRTISVPIVWYRRLLNATEAQRRNWTISCGGYGIHWPDIDEDLSTEGLLRGSPAPRNAQIKSPETRNDSETIRVY